MCNILLLLYFTCSNIYILSLVQKITYNMYQNSNKKMKNKYIDLKESIYINNMIKHSNELEETDKVDYTEFKCIKCPLSNIIRDGKLNNTKIDIKLNNDELENLIKNNNLSIDYINTISSKDIYSIINDAVKRTNFVIIKVYLLIRLWILYKYHNQQVIPTITTETIRIAMRSLCKKGKGNAAKGDNKILEDEFRNLFKFKSLEDKTNLASHVFPYCCTTILTAIENNVKLHYKDYINHFVNAYFKHKYSNEIQNNEFQKQLKTELKTLKVDLRENTTNCHDKYHEWLLRYRNKLVPNLDEGNDTIFKDINCNPQKYLSYMIYMNLKLEKLGCKMFHFFPLQTSIIPRYIPFDTSALVDLFISKHTNLYYSNITCLKDIIWKAFFNIKFKKKNYVSNHTIITDGYSASVRFTHKKNVVKLDEINRKKQQGRVECKGLSKTEKKDRLEKKKNENSTTCICGSILKSINESHRKSKKHQNWIKNKEINPINRIKDLVQGSIESKEEDIQIIENHVQDVEFPYIDEVPKINLKATNHIFIDPGKRSLLTMMDDNNKFLTYSNSQHLKETKRLYYHKKLKKYKDTYILNNPDKNLNILESEFSKYNSKTCIIDKFIDFINKKMEFNEYFYALYEDKIFRQYRWYSYINKQRSESRMIKNIIKNYGNNSIIIIGDWSINKQFRNYISTPNISLKRTLKKHFPVYNIDEYRTSCLHYKTENYGSNLYLVNPKDKYNKSRKIHSILTFKMENNRLGCINRDRNSCKNIKKLFDFYMETDNRPDRYKRGYIIN
jgi:hypothetical protein